MRAMDAITDFASKKKFAEIKKFFVAGASKVYINHFLKKE